MASIALGVPQKVCALVIAVLLYLPALAAANRPQVHPLLTPDPAGVAAAKERAASQLQPALPTPGEGLGSMPQQSPSLRARELAPSSPLLDQPGLGASDNSAGNQGSPPDTTGAIGPNDYVEFVNSSVAVYDKTDLSRIGTPADLDAFVGESGDSVFDPQIQWDDQGQRWFYLADDCAPVTLGNASCSGITRLVYGWSKTSDPTNLGSGWCQFAIRTDNAGGTTLFDDFPKLGHDDNHLIFGTNVFNAAGNFMSSRIWSVAKPAAGTITTCPAAATPHYFTGTAASPVEDAANIAASPLRTSDGNPAFTPVPANTVNSQAAGFIVAADFSSTTASQIMAWHMGGTDTSPSLVADGNMNVVAYSPPGNVPQPGSSDQLDSADGRLTQAVAQADPDASNAEAVWTQHTINGTGGRSVARWYELLPTSHTVRQQGVVSDPNDFVFNAAISPSVAGNEAAITYNTASSSQLVQAHYSSRIGSMPLGTMHADVFLGASSGIDQDFTCPSNNPGDPTVVSCRWGDYAGMSPDPSSIHFVWGSNQLVTGPAGVDGKAPSWVTRNFATAPADFPMASMTCSPATAFQNKPVSCDGSGSTDPDGGSIASYDWNFGDGSPHGSGATASHSYQQTGTFTVTLTTTDSDQGLSDTSTQQVTVQAGAPTASFTVSPNPVGRNQTVTLDGSASHDAEGPGGIASYAWDFNGDGTIDQTTTSPVTTTTYGTLGGVRPRLIVTDSDDGLQSPPATQSVTVQNSPPIAQFTSSPATPVVSQVVKFSAAGSHDPDSAGPLTYRWDLDGDGAFEVNSGQSQTVQHTYRTPGLIKVSLMVQDPDGATTIVTHQVQVFTTPLVRATLRMPAKAKRAAFRSSGVTGRVGCSAACTLTVLLQVPHPLAQALKRQLGASSTIGSATIKIKDSKLVRLKIKPSARSARALAQVPSFKLTVRAIPSRRGSIPRAATARVRITP